MPNYEDCICGHRYEKSQCAHVLHQWMISHKGYPAMKSSKPGQQPGGYYNPPGSSYVVCSEGRLVRAGEMLDYFIKSGKFKEVAKEDPGEDYFIWTNSGRSGHVYYGTEYNCRVGTGAFSHTEIRFFEKK